MAIEKTYTDVPHHPYSFSYSHAGSRWSLTIPCMSWADAEERAKALNLTLDGVLALPRPDIPEQFLPPPCVTPPADECGPCEKTDAVPVAGPESVTASVRATWALVLETSLVDLASTEADVRARAIENIQIIGHLNLPW